ncbi:hypothetical protein CWS97_26480 [Klebsiella pneumoniae]|uniref:hypothetical protein n=1 Tax=Klebsiella pneumoniae TaxID=573 RepID=UPI001C7F4902|nr:hypothetical protein [Klebsiella pneumoniae]MBX4669454.1 hypothetical protein [Klebsiella pneumoniae]MCE0286362.1 hypothetical protein [Klebsiella pneumoniae]MDV5186296.1 hypothetical protein [Klebsiella pneumoniae]HBQ3890778.1 hypothetical protein [Klebsiella pneumoniae]HBR0938295.1 hypothetical protein [Klebsiella pneumoniae]
MKIIFDQETYKGLIYEANLKDKPAAALVVQIIREYLQKQTGSQLGADLSEEKNEQKRITISGN